jgi:type IV secretion system protein VirB5
MGNLALSAPIVPAGSAGTEAGRDTGRLGENNPYLAVRADRTNAYLALRRALRMAWWFAGGLLVLDLGLVVAYVRAAESIRVVPYIVRVDGAGQTLGVEPAEVAAEPDRAMVQHAVRLFLLNSRTITSDRAVQRRLLADAYAFADGRAVGYLNDWFSKNPPFSRAELASVTPRITSFLRLGDGEVYQVQWDEERRTAAGNRTTTESWRALVTVRVEPPNAIADRLTNPLGIKVVDLDWTPLAPEK